MVFQFLSLKELIYVGSACKRFYRITGNQEIYIQSQRRMSKDEEEQNILLPGRDEMNQISLAMVTEVIEENKDGNGPYANEGSVTDQMQVMSERQKSPSKKKKRKRRSDK